MSQDPEFVTVVSTGALARVVQEFDDGSLEAQPLFEDEPVVLLCWRTADRAQRIQALTPAMRRGESTLLETATCRPDRYR